MVCAKENCEEKNIENSSMCLVHNIAKMKKIIISVSTVTKDDDFKEEVLSDLRKVWNELSEGDPLPGPLSISNKVIILFRLIFMFTYFHFFCLVSIV